MRFIALLIPLALAACVHRPLDYRVTTERDGILLLPPNTRVATETGLISVDALDVLNSGRRCPRRAGASSELSARVVNVARRRRTARALRFTGPRATFGSTSALGAALDTWWDAPTNRNFIACHVPDRDATRRSLLAQRPMTSDDVLEAQFAFRGDRTEDGEALLRTVLLRPGMRVCASDVANDRPGSGLRLSGTSCTRLLGAANGGTLFDPTIGVMNALIETQYGPGVEVRRIASWAEVQRPGRVPHMFVLIQPRRMPVSLPMSQRPEEHVFPIIAAVQVRPESGVTPASLESILAAGKADHEERIEALCTMPDVICYSFGERGVITADFQVLANGAPLDVGVGATVGDVISTVAPDLFAFDSAAAGTMLGRDPAARARLEDTLRRLTMRRFFEGRFVRVDLLSAGAIAAALPLQPGDQLRW